MEPERRKIKETSSLSQSRKGPKTCYGATRAPQSAPDYKLVPHTLEPSDTLQGIAIKYGVTVEQIRRVNKLWTSDNILVFKTLNIPVKLNVGGEEDSLDSWGGAVNLVDVSIDLKNTKGNDCKATKVTQKNGNKAKNSESLCKFLNKLDDQMKFSIKQAEQQRRTSGAALINNLETKVESESINRHRVVDTNKRLPTQVSLSSPTRQISQDSNEMNTLDDLFEL